LGEFLLIGRLLYLGCFFKEPKRHATFSTEKSMYALALTENGLGYSLGDFFTNSSGHPAAAVPFLVSPALR
jgi:hypothetical protein